MDDRRRYPCWLRRGAAAGAAGRLGPGLAGVLLPPLADVACYAEIDPGRERRLVGIYPFVGDPWWIAYGAGPPAAEGPLPLFPAQP